MAQRGGSLPSFADLELIRTEAQMPVSRFLARLGIPSSTWYYWREGHLRGRPVRRWPAPVVDEIEEPAAKKAYEFSAWGHRKIWAMLRTDGHAVSQSSVKRALARRDLLLPVRYQAERRAIAKARRATFDHPPERRNRVWQMDFSEFETARGGTWQLVAVVAYAAKGAWRARRTAPRPLGMPPGPWTRRSGRPSGSFRPDRPSGGLDEETGEVHPVVIVSDNGPAFKSSRFALFLGSWPGPVIWG